MTAIGAPGVVTNLRKELAPMATWLACEDAKTRQGANTTLGRMGISETLRAEAVASQLLHPNESVRVRAAGALREMGPQVCEPHVAELATQLQHRDLSRRLATFEVLGNLGELAGSQAESVSTHLWDPDPQVRTVAAKTLARLGDAGVPHIEAIVQQRKHRDVRAREAIAACLGDIGEHLPVGVETETTAEAVADTLCFLAQDNTESVRVNAGRSLARLGPLATPRLAKLLPAFQSFEPGHCKAAVEVFVHIGPASAEFAGDLAPLVFHKDASVRRLAAKALGGMGTEAHWHAEELAELMVSGPPEKQRLAVAALSRMGEVGAQVLEVKAVHDDHGVQTAARLALEEMRGAA